ncbi:MAG: N-acetylmuramoyl-L-alanine amidase [Anaerolineae bacterium]
MNANRWAARPVVALIIGLLSWTTDAAPPKSQIEAAQALLRAAPLPAVHDVRVADNALTVCLDADPATLQADAGLGAERLEADVARALTPLDWRALHVHARDPEDGVCKPLSDFLPAPEITALTAPPTARLTAAPSPLVEVFPRSLAGKTIFVSAGHGWQWNGSAWRTQRPPYQEFIEDHNNAEVVNQYLIPYLENAGATVIPVRERDWNAARVVVDDQDAGFNTGGAWNVSIQPGYQDGDYHFATTVSGSATATATWTLEVPQRGLYALYAWVRPGANRTADARYTVHHAGGSSDVWLDQRIRPMTWRYLGTFPFADNAIVTLDNASAEAGNAVIADALRLGGGDFDDLTAGTGKPISTTAPYAPDKPWWETATFYYSQWMGLDREDWPYFNDVVARPMYARWQHAGVEEDAVYISWHTNGYNGDNDVISGTVSYVHDGSTYPMTESSEELQQAVHTELVHDIQTGWSEHWVDLGQRRRNLGEVRMLWDENPAHRMPGVLLEIGYHDNEHDANALKDPRFNRLAARAVYQGILRYFAAEDGSDLVQAPEPPTHLRVQNVGGGSGALHVAWQPPPTGAESDGLYGDAATGYRVYTSPDGFAWSAPLTVTKTETTLTGFKAGETVYVRVTATNDGGESFPTETLGARVGDHVPLLLVNGFDKLNRFGLVEEVDPTEGYNLRLWEPRINSRRYVVHHGDAVPAEYAWDSAGNEAVAAGDVLLSAYTVVDWILGEESLEEEGTLNAAERQALTLFLENDGALLIGGTELLWELVAQDRDAAFARTQLHTDYVNDDAGTYTVAPTADGAFAGLTSFTFDAPEEYDADFPDVLATSGDASPALTYAGGAGGVAAVQYAAGCQRTLVLGFPFEVIRAEARPDVMTRALDFLDECVTPPVEAVETGITAPGDGSSVNAVPPFEGWATGEGLQRVEVQVTDALSQTWDGGDWGTAATWLTATGTLTWHYTLPVLDDGSYTLRARAVASQTDMTPARIGFTLDRVVPTAPTPLTPTGGITLTTPAATLQWSPPPDDGAPLSYEVALDNVTRTVHSTMTTIAVGSGTHVWRVRAVDAAANVGPWSEEARFNVKRVHLFLPLILRNHTPTNPAPADCEVWLSEEFEGETDWTFNALAERVDTPVHGGEKAVRVGLPPGTPGDGETRYASISRALELPTDAASITLTYWAYPIAEDNDPDDFHYVGPQDALIIDRDDARVWARRTLDLSSYAGTRVLFFFGTKNDGDGSSAALVVDDITIEVCRLSAN